MKLVEVPSVYRASRSWRTLKLFATIGDFALCRIARAQTDFFFVAFSDSEDLNCAESQRRRRTFSCLLVGGLGFYAESQGRRRRIKR